MDCFFGPIYIFHFYYIDGVLGCDFQWVMKVFTVYFQHRTFVWMFQHFVYHFWFTFTVEYFCFFGYYVLYMFRPLGSIDPRFWNYTLVNVFCCIVEHFQHWNNTIGRSVRSSYLGPSCTNIMNMQTNTSCPL